MRKLFLSLIITLGVLAAPTAWAGGKVQSPGTSLVNKGLTVTLETYLKTICGATYDSKTETWSMNTSTAPSDAAKGDVYFVAINDYWIGSSGAPDDATITSGYSFYDQVNEGVDYIKKVDNKSMQTTSSGRFYTHEAENVDKFFFIERRSAYRTKSANGGNYDSSWSPFGWYNEWSYVENTSGGYTSLTPSLGNLSDGAPFFSPHNCDTSFETNHYITLNDRDDHTTPGYYFTAYLYIPKYVNTGSSSTTVTEKTGETEVVYNGETYRIYDSQSNWGSTRTKVSDAPDNLYILENGEYILFKSSSYSDKYYIEDFWGSQGQALTVYTKSEQEKTITITVPAKNIPYVFFYRIKLGEIDDAGSIKSTLNPPTTTPSESDMKCYYTVDLDWGTSFDRFASQLPNTSYDTMKEHFIIKRSYDKTNWETIGTKDVLGNNVALGTDKVFTDNTLPDFNETTKKIGYTVYYQIISEVQKEDGTVMSTTTSNDITVNIPGTTPFKLTLEAGNTSEYQPGSMNGEEYTEGKNYFVNTLTAAKAVSETVVTLAEGVKLELVRTTYDKDGNETTEAIKSSTCTATTTLDQLIAAIGTVPDEVTTEAGEKYDAQYQLVLTYNDGTTTESNIVKIVNSKVSNTSVSVHRSGTPDAATCAETELFRNEVKFKPQMSAVPGAGYYIYCNGKKVLTLDDNTNNTDFTGSNDTKYTVDKDGYITMTFFAEHAPIAVGESGETSDTPTSFHYAVAHFDAAKNTYGSAAKASSYSGAKDELVVMFNNPTSTLGSHYDLVFIRPVVTWKLNKDADDVASPIRYDIYMKMGQAKFEENGDPSSGRTGNVTGWEGDNFGKYILRTTIEKDQSGNLSTSYADEIYYARRQQHSGTWVNPIADDEIRPVSYYVKAVYSDDAVVKQNVKEKNSDVFAVKASAGGIFTAIDDVAAEGVSVEANDGVITVTGAIGTIVVYSATGQAVATAQGDGGVTTIDASNLNGVYIVKANNMKPTKILIK